MRDRVLILAPRGRDAAIAADLLGRHQIACCVCPDLPALLDALAEGAGAALITEEALASADKTDLTHWIENQPQWSDFPFVILANGHKSPRTPLATATLEALGNIVLLERPLHADAMLGALRSALKARGRQYEIREFALTLERRVEERTQQLAKASDSLEFALNAAGMAGWEYDLATGRSERTARHHEIYGYDAPQPDWGVARFLQHVPEEDRDRVSAEIQAGFARGELDVECPIVGADGVARWIAVQGRARIDDAGRPVQMTGVVIDITARRDADAKLAQAQKMDAIGQLTGGVAHDFNNLLTPIVGSLDMLRRRLAGDARAERLVAGALQAAERAATLTQRLLAFARRQTLEPRAVDIAGLIDGLVDLMRRSLGPTIAVRLEFPDEAPFARVDPNQLELALLNLAINARDAMPDGGELLVAVRPEQIARDNSQGLAPGDYVRIATRDTGAGMDAETLEKAIEPFFSTKGLGKGTGLGLSMVHGLAAQSGGALQLSSTIGKGTEVVIWLPATDSSALAPVGDAPEPIHARGAASVLLVDDEELVRTATAEMLRDIGYTVIEAESGAQAIAAIRSGTDVDVLVTDYLMPGMTGAALIAELRAALIDFPTLLVTGYANAGEDVPEDVPRLAKPFRQVELAARIDELLLRPRATPQDDPAGALIA
jgi:signal transduction histidine kinase/CheY-like chemotaxis protein